VSELPPAPTDRHLKRLGSVLAPLARVTQPTLHGVERIPEGGALFVGNHTLYGLLDLPFMVHALWEQRGIRIRGVGEHAHYALPVWRDVLELGGMVRGTRDNVRGLMRDRQDVLVFPGGAGEVMKGRGQKYRLLWKERLGFARLAIESGYPIVPFAAVGVEEMFDIVADSQTPGFAQISDLMQRLVGMPLPPIARGFGPTMLPRPERLYFWFGEAVDTVRFDGRAEDDAAARTLRNEVRAAVEGGIAELHERRRQDPQRSIVTRLSRHA
jgi:1-acyl-sn-glycerol-3-phosphate acyltransferase